MVNVARGPALDVFLWLCQGASPGCHGQFHNISHLPMILPLTTSIFTRFPVMFTAVSLTDLTNGVWTYGGAMVILPGQEMSSSKKLLAQH